MGKPLSAHPPRFLSLRRPEPMKMKPSKGRQRGESLSGALSFRTDRGQHVVQVQPPKASAPQLRRLAPYINSFRFIQELFHYQTPQEIESWLQTTRNSPFMPRDLYTAHAYGRLFSLLVPGYREIFPVTARRDTSENIDLLARKPGQLLLRGTDLWKPLPWGTATQILQSQGPNKPPIWADNTGGGGGGSLPWTAPELANFTIDHASSSTIVASSLAGGIAISQHSSTSLPYTLLTQSRTTEHTRLIAGLNVSTALRQGQLSGIALMDDAGGEGIFAGLSSDPGDHQPHLTFRTYTSIRGGFGTIIKIDEEWYNAGPIFIGLTISGTKVKFTTGSDPHAMREIDDTDLSKAGDADTWAIWARSPWTGSYQTDLSVFHWKPETT